MSNAIRFTVRNGIALESNQEYKEFGADKVFVLTKYDTKLGFVPAFKVGYSRDLATKGKTLINPFHAAMPYSVRLSKQQVSWILQ